MPHSRSKTYRSFASGFTLVELVVAIAIVGTLMSISLANFRQPFRYKDIQAAGQQLIGTIRSLQLSATAGARVSLCQDGSGLCATGADCPSSTVCAPGVPFGGYGLHIATCTDAACGYRTFVDANADQEIGTDEITGTPTIGAVKIDAIAIAQSNAQGVCGEPTTVSAPASAALLFRSTSTVAMINDAEPAADTCAVAIDLESVDGLHTSRILFSLVSGVVTLTQ
jgi:prepilin-type N-terminal cleavage/methylation domain-containing protein